MEKRERGEEGRGLVRRVEGKDSEESQRNIVKVFVLQMYLLFL